MNTYAVAIDLGASSGRHMLGHLEQGRIVLEEIYRFPNGMQQRDGHLRWDTDALFGHILEGLKRCGDKGIHPQTIGIDTWGVDYALLDETGALASPPIAYRDSRTAGMPARLDGVLSPSTLYARTGIARQEYNTIYQLMTEDRSARRTLLFMPCYLSYLLTGCSRNEYTIASTSGLLNAQTRTWDETVLSAAGIDPRWLGDAPAAPGASLGALLPEIARAVGFSCDVILPPCHDTGCAFLATPALDEHAACLSSGTWSLLGAELPAPVLTEEARLSGFTNEGGYGGSIRFLRNIMGMWLLQSLRREWNDRLSFAQMADAALEGAQYTATFDPADERFLAPKCMEDEIRAALLESGAPAPKTDAELLYSVHHSLACCYRDGIRSLERLTGCAITSINIVGGGSQNQTLNRLTARETGLPVSSGPVEGTALGNLMAQWIATGALADTAEAREALRRSTEPVVWRD